MKAVKRLAHNGLAYYVVFRAQPTQKYPKKGTQTGAG